MECVVRRMLQPPPRSSSTRRHSSPARLGVQPRGRFVQQKQERAVDSGKEQSEPLLLAARLLFEPLPGLLFKTDSSHSGMDLLSCEFHPIETAIEPDDLSNG
jgi:hypothetical protein